MSKKTLLIIGVILAAVILLFVLRTGGGKDPASDGIAVDTPGSVLGNDFVIALLGVQKVSLDTSVLGSPVFQSLAPSGAVVDTNPLRGKNDPFSPDGGNATGNDSAAASSAQSPRAVLLGGGETVSLLPPDARIVASKITTTTATITVSGLPANVALSVSLVGSGGGAIFVSNFSYKAAAGEYSAVATGLSSKQRYVMQVINPEIYASLQGEFDTK